MADTSPASEPRGVESEGAPPAVDPGAVAGLLGPLFLVVLVVAVIAALAAVLRRPRGGEALGAVAGGSAAADALPARRARLPDSEALGRQGRFAEAIHALLLHALAELDQRSREVAPSATSREIVRRLAPSAAVASALHPLVVAVERMHFGRDPGSLQDYTDCAAHYRKFTEAWRTTR